LTAEQYAENFSEANPRLTAQEARIEADRCYYCFDAPCQTACPTGIDVPSFIARIAQGNARGAAKKILEENALGGMCARVCPTEILCEQACVRNTQEDKPVEIGALQRYATDTVMEDTAPPLFTRAANSGKRVAVVGAGPAGLSCAHRLSLLGHAVEVFEAKDKLGGLNEYGLATYKTVNNFAQKEIDWLLSIGGITVKTGVLLGRDTTLEALLESYDAVFLGLGLGAVNALGIAEPQAKGLMNAVDFIAELRQAEHPSLVPVGRRVVVIGGGMTAIDAAVQAKKLGAEEATIVYRRGPASMGASAHEQSWAKDNGVQIRHWLAPKALHSAHEQITGIELAYTEMRDGRLQETGEHLSLQADMVLRAIGQTFVDSGVAALSKQGGKLQTDAQGRTSHSRVWAGGDCRYGGRDLTVEAVQHGKLAAIDIDRALRA
jgi:glutamate synthase (NADPH/NADH) small chain